MLLNPKMHCPLCAAIVPNRHPVFEPRTCQHCGAKLQPCAKQASIRFLPGVAIAIALALGFGCRGWTLILVTLLLLVPSGVLCAPLLEWLWPTRLEPWDGRRVI